MCINLTCCNFHFVVWVSSWQWSLAPDVFQVGSLSFRMPSHVWPHATLPLTGSKTRSSTPVCHDASAQLPYVAVFKSLIPLLMRLVHFSVFSDTGYSSCGFLLTCSFILLINFIFICLLLLFLQAVLALQTAVQQFSSWIASKYYQMPHLLISGRATWIFFLRVL